MDRFSEESAADMERNYRESQQGDDWQDEVTVDIDLMRLLAREESATRCALIAASLMRDCAKIPGHTGIAGFAAAKTIFEEIVREFNLAYRQDSN